MKLETIARKDREAVKLRRQQQDLKHLEQSIQQLIRFAMLANLPQWIIDELDDLFTRLP